HGRSRVIAHGAGEAAGVGQLIGLKITKIKIKWERMMLRHLKSAVFVGLLGAAAAAMMLPPATPQDKQQIKIGFGMAETGPLGPNGKSALLAMEIWVEEVNAKGGLLGRPVQLVHYDDQSNPSTVPGIYSKLLDVDKVDVIVGGYGTNM